jgi:hypothetical protein
VKGITTSGPSEPEAALLYTELYAGKGENGFMKYTVSFHVKKELLGIRAVIRTVNYSNIRIIKLTVTVQRIFIIIRRI